MPDSPQTRKCPIATKRGAPCRAPVLPSGYCLHHDPAKIAWRERRNRKGGMRVHSGPIPDVAEDPVDLKSVDGCLSALERLHRQLARGAVDCNRARALTDVIGRALSALDSHVLEAELTKREADAIAAGKKLRTA